MGNIKIKLYANKSLDIIQSVEVSSDLTLKPGDVLDAIDERIKTYEMFAHDIKNSGKLIKFTSNHLETLNRKLFLASIKAGQTYISETRDGDDIEKPLTDCKTAAMFWVCNTILGEIYAMHKLPPKEAAEVKAYLIPAIAEKVNEVARNRNRTKKGGKPSLMFTNKVNMIISSLTPKDYEQDGDGLKTLKYNGEIIVDGTALQEIKAEKVEGKLKAFDVNTAMVYMMLQSELANNMQDGSKTEDEKRAVTISLKEYMSKRGLSDKKSARASLDAASDAIIGFRAVVKDILGMSDGGEDYEKRGFSISDNARYKDGYFTMTFTKEFVSYITQGHIIELPDNFYKMSLRKDTNAFYIALKLCFHAGYNKKKKHNSANPCIISVESLLKECRTLPKYADIKGTGYIYKRIISPFKSALQAIEAKPGNPEGFIKYSFTHAKAEPLTPGELDDLENGRIKYDDFIKLYVYFEIIDNDRAKEIEI